MGSVKCGVTPASFDFSLVGKTEGLVVDPEGIVYFSDFGSHVGRYAPPYDKAPEKTWATVAGATILGVTYDPKKKVIYAGSRGQNGKLVAIDAGDPTNIKTLADTESGYNGITLAADGSVFYTDQSGGKVYRVTGDGMKNLVASVSDANGIAFGPDGFLYVLTYGQGIVTRFKLSSNVEMAGTREMFIKLAKGNADGIAFDNAGNMYVTSGVLWKITPQKVASMIDLNGGANVEFGAGALSCKELLWAAGDHRITLDVEGMTVPWHLR